jgi:serine/threonine-protein kinase
MRSGTLVGGRYRLEERLGTGGAGEVWRALDERLGAPVAIKLLHDVRPAQVARLAREASVLARLAHPRIVRALDCDAEHDPPFLVLELVDGGTLAELPLPRPPAEVRTILDAILDALEAAHAAGVAHRDLTPSNVLLDRRGEVVVTDFGLARGDVAPRVTASGILVGTPEYWAPEHGRGEAPTPAGDLYAAGAIAFELSTGQLPFPAAGAADRLAAASRRLVEDPPEVASVAPDAAAAEPQLARLIHELLARDPARRPTATAARRRLAAGPVRRHLAGILTRRG